MHQQNGSFHSQPIPRAGELCMNMQPQPTLQSQSQLPHSLPQETQHEWFARGSTSQSGLLPKYPPPFQGFSQNFMPSSQPIGQQCPPSEPNEQSPAIPGQLQQHATVQQTQHQAQALHPQFTRPLDLPLQAPPLHTKPKSQLPHSLPQETQHEWLARGSTSQSGSLPRYPPPFQSLSQNYMPSSQPIGQQCPPSQPNEQSPAIPGQLQQHATVQQTQHQAQGFHPQFTRPLDLPLQEPPLHTKPPMRLSPTSSLQALLLSQSNPICHPNAQQASTLPPQQSQQALPDLKQIHSPPPQFKPVPKPCRNLKRSSGGFDSPVGMSKSHMQIQVATYIRSYAGYVFNTSRCIFCKGAIT